MKTLLFLLIVAMSPAWMSETLPIPCKEKEVDPSHIKMHWLGRMGVPIRTFDQLFRFDPALKCAMNGGMYDQKYQPVGLYVENGVVLRPIRRVNNPKYNFGMQPQGAFIITQGNRARIIPIGEVKLSDIKFATQSAPMLVINGRINPKLTHSHSAYTRNGVGVLPDGHVLLAMSSTQCTFQEFANYFLSRGCVSALYLDGGISGFEGPQEQQYVFYEYGPFIGVN